MTQGRIVIDSERCKGCELCASVCPQHVIQMSTTFNLRGYRPARLVDPGGACTGCAVCAVICPDVAITVYRQANKEPRTSTRRVGREPEAYTGGSRLSILGSVERRAP